MLGRHDTQRLDLGQASEPRRGQLDLHQGSAHYLQACRARGS